MLFFIPTIFCAYTIFFPLLITRNFCLLTSTSLFVFPQARHLFSQLGIVVPFLILLFLISQVILFIFSHLQILFSKCAFSLSLVVYCFHKYERNTKLGVSSLQFIFLQLLCFLLPKLLFSFTNQIFLSFPSQELYCFSN